MQIKRVLRAVMAGVLFLHLTACGENDTSRLQPPSVQLAVVDRRPVKLEDGKIYSYNTDGSWEQIGPDGEAIQIVDGEYLCALDTDGKLYYDWVPTDEEPLPLTSGYTQYMAWLALEINETEHFACVNQEPIRLYFRALLQSGEILFQSGDEYTHLQLEELPVSLSGAYILTDAGNIWFMRDEDVSELKCVYSGGDIIEIDANNNAGRCLALTRDHHVVSLQFHGSALEVSDWNHIISIEQEFNYAVGLTDKGEVLYAAVGHANESIKNTEALVIGTLSEWSNVIQIAANGADIIGLKQDGSCYILDLDDYTQSEP